MIRVFDLSMMRVLKSSKFRHPELPASTIVVVPVRKLKLSGRTLLSPAQASGKPVVVKIPVPIMLAMTIAVACVKPSSRRSVGVGKFTGT